MLVISASKMSASLLSRDDHPSHNLTSLHSHIHTPSLLSTSFQGLRRTILSSNRHLRSNSSLKPSRRLSSVTKLQQGFSRYRTASPACVPSIGLSIGPMRRTAKSSRKMLVAIANKIVRLLISDRDSL